MYELKKNMAPLQLAWNLNLFFLYEIFNKSNFNSLLTPNTN